MTERPRRMTGAVLPGDSTVELRSFDVPTPGHGEVLVRTKSTTICGSDIRCIYHQHLGKGPEGYQPGTIAGHEPCGRIEESGPGCRRFREGDRVIVYHISGCGLCNDCRRGYMISCTSPWRRAYGWQRHGGMAPFVLAEEKDLVLLPDALSYSDGAQVACGFGTVYEGLERVGVSGDDAVLVTGLGPVGLATAMLARAMGAERVLGIDVRPERLDLARSLGLFDEVLLAGRDNVAQVRALTGGAGVERAFDCSAGDEARLTCIQAARKWGRIVFMGEGGTVGFRPSEDVIHDQKSVHGSWVTTIWRMEELVERLVRWKLHPDRLVTHRFPLEKASEAYALMASGRCGKVAVAFDEELR
ncbi:MAG TPA: zinc-binding dehydrogenase [Vicinamibacteria bacterium]|nr:zinc-binding dehydrogenase [Vicinamibacteria bacterium]